MTSTAARGSPQRRQHWEALALLLVLTAAAALAGGAGSADSADFYQQLAKPAWAPPASVFGPVWTVLYLFMAIAAWLVVRESGWLGARPALSLYLVQLGLNALWTWLFFRWKLGGAALVEILILWTILLVTVRVFWRARPLAGVLLVPYVAWVTFAAALTFAVWRRNSTLL